MKVFSSNSKQKSQENETSLILPQKNCPNEYNTEEG